MPASNVSLVIIQPVWITGAPMSSGLIALIDDVASLAKVAAASLDDVVVHAGNATTKAAGIVIDDAAVTPRYVVGFAAKRELPILAKIAVGSLKNKLLILLPAALALSYFAPWLITPLLMTGGLYLCFEGTEKVWELIAHQSQSPQRPAPEVVDAKTFENEKVAGAIATDFILSAEIMALTLHTVAASPFVTKALVLAFTGLLLTIAVYGVVALIVKADDAGLALSASASAFLRAIGRGLVQGMPVFLQVLSLVGTAAMVWVGGGIIVHGFEEYGFKALPNLIHALEGAAVRAVGSLAGLTEWAVHAFASGLVGLAAGAALMPFAALFHKPAAHA